MSDKKGVVWEEGMIDENEIVENIELNGNEGEEQTMDLADADDVNEADQDDDEMDSEEPANGNK